MRVLTAIVVTGMLACGNGGTVRSTPPEPVFEPDPDPSWSPPPPAPPRVSPAPRVEQGESSWTVEGRNTTTQPHMRVDLPTPPASQPEPDASPAGSCCRMCHKGKACGNTCIARNRVCHTPPGCACDE